MGRPPRGEDLLHDIGCVGADHQHLAVSHVDDAHQPEGDGQAEAHQEQDRPEAHPVEEVTDETSDPDVRLETALGLPRGRAHAGVGVVGRPGFAAGRGPPRSASRRETAPQRSVPPAPPHRAEAWPSPSSSSARISGSCFALERARQDGHGGGITRVAELERCRLPHLRLGAEDLQALEGALYHPEERLVERHRLLAGLDGQRVLPARRAPDDRARRERCRRRRASGVGPGPDRAPRP